MDDHFDEGALFARDGSLPASAEIAPIESLSFISAPDRGRECLIGTGPRVRGQVCPPSVLQDYPPSPDGYHSLSTEADISELGVPDKDPSGNAYGELLFPRDRHKLLLASRTPPGHSARLRIYLARPKKAVVERDTDVLTRDEMKTRAKEVTVATEEELQIWVGHGCFTRHPRQGARNILDVRWVAKWKWVKKQDDPHRSSAATACA